MVSIAAVILKDNIIDSGCPKSQYCSFEQENDYLQKIAVFGLIIQPNRLHYVDDDDWIQRVAYDVAIATLPNRLDSQ